MLLWVAQALGALDRMTPHATTTQARRAATKPTDLAVSRSVLLQLSSNQVATRALQPGRRGFRVR